MPALSQLIGTVDGDWHNLDWDNWLYGLVAGFIGGGSSAVVSGFVVGIQDPKDYNFANRKFYTLISSVFVASGLLNMFAYLKQHPLPDKTVITMERTEHTENPPMTITTKVEETKITQQPKGDT